MNLNQRNTTSLSVIKRMKEIKTKGVNKRKLKKRTILTAVHLFVLTFIHPFQKEITFLPYNSASFMFYNTKNKLFFLIVFRIIVAAKQEHCGHIYVGML